MGFPDGSSLGSLLGQELWPQITAPVPEHLTKVQPRGEKSVDKICLQMSTSVQSHPSYYKLILPFANVVLSVWFAHIQPAFLLATSSLAIWNSLPYILLPPFHHLQWNKSLDPLHLLNQHQGLQIFRVPEKFPRMTCQVEASGRFHLEVRLQGRKMNIPGARTNIRDSRWTWLLWHLLICRRNYSREAAGSYGAYQEGLCFWF